MENQSVTPAQESAWPPPYCKACRFWDQFDERSGECRRHAPKPAMYAETSGDDSESHFSSPIWPTTRVDDWCGEHETLGVGR